MSCWRRDWRGQGGQGDHGKALQGSRSRPWVLDWEGQSDGRRGGGIQHLFPRWRFLGVRERRWGQGS